MQTAPYDLSNVSRLIRDEFDDATRRKGADYAAQGRVRLLEVGPRRVAAQVIGTRRYEVSLRFQETEIELYCGCPRFRDGYSCKHLWAVAVALESRDARGALDDPAERRTSAWKRLLRSAGLPAEDDAPAPPLPADSEIVYWIDVSEALRGEVTVRAGLRRRSPRGGWTRAFEMTAAALNGATLRDPDDRLLVRLFGADAPEGVDDWDRAKRLSLGTDDMDFMLPLLARTGRFHLDKNGEGDLGEPWTWDEGVPWTFAPLVEPGKQLRLWGRFERGGEVLDLAAPDLVLSGGYFFAASKISKFDFAMPFEWIRTLRRDGAITVDAAETSEFLAELHGLPGGPPIALPESLKFAEVRVPPRPVLAVTAKEVDHTPRPAGRLAATATFDYLGSAARPFQAGARVVDAAGKRIVHRDPAIEAGLIDTLRKAGFRRPPKYRWSEGVDFEIDAARLPRAVPELIAAGWRVEAEGLQYRAPGKFRLEVTSGVDWFDLKGGVEFGDQVAPFPALLKAAKRGDRHVVLGDGSFGLLPEEWLARRGIVLGAGAAQGDALRFRPGQAMLLDTLLAAEERVAVDPGFERARRELRTFESLVPLDPPEGFLGDLRPYQKLSLGWFDFLRRVGWGGCLADDMGLGKTVQALALLAGRRAKRKPSLVVVPRSVVFNWKSEAARFAPELKVVERVRDAAGLKGADVVLTTYGLLRRDAPFLKDVAFDYVILDEAQAIKNASGATAKAARLLKADHRLAMSGTPIENHLGELWSLMEFLNPGLLGAASVFGSASGADEESRGVLARALRPFILRRTKEQVAPELPARIEQTVQVDLDADERRRYDELKEHYRKTLLDGGDFRKSRFHALEALLRLRQAACHGGLIDPRLASKPGTKLEVLIERLREVVDEGHKALVFSQFTSLLAILKTHLDKAGLKYEYLDGATRDRESRVKGFQGADGPPIFLISLKAGGLGLNLTAAEYVFLLDPWWNPASEAQAIDRAHRIGQEKPVMALRLVARDTVEERVIELQRSKRALADAILNADGGLMKGLTRDDLSLLLS